jgi:hypothetical protein
MIIVGKRVGKGVGKGAGAERQRIPRSPLINFDQFSGVHLFNTGNANSIL